ncbi:NAD(P)H-dependent flavin oxidoreductase [Anaeromyxobacter paludicola]|uniref:Propionate 3-nitronate monooxygenase n=1 Tax=Anaeromyxobacter paludicola TaxID=2918171 RepID=A0ABM7XBB6_9BACT|nr:nitronate monooxygenase [Anaeromyxobacter paludicola]BDG09153.1 nitronate monooxygenase [Anaeromyxobacter paludicola]
MTWPRDLADRLGVRLPIFLAPMAGGPSTPALAAAVSEAGGLGALGCGYSAPEQIRAEVEEVRRRTQAPFAVNLFAPEPHDWPPPAEPLARAASRLQAYRDELGLGPVGDLPPPPDFDAQLELVLELRPRALSITSGALPPARVKTLHDAGILVMATATTPAEAEVLEASGVDAVVTQGAEAGGHRANFLAPGERSFIGTMALVPRVADAVKVPVVAAGGIMDGRGIAACLALGASAVSLGTAFLACDESGAAAAHKAALRAAPGDDATGLTRAFSGKPARGLVNRFMREQAASADVLPYPAQNQLTAGLRREAARQGRSDLMSFWAGQGAPLARGGPAGRLLAALAEEAEAALRRLG